MDNERITARTSPETEQTAAQNPADGLGAVLSNPELMAKLPQVMAMLRPMMEQAGSGSAEDTGTDRHTDPQATVPPTPEKSPADRRAALLIALKPFLSEDRRNTVDAMLRISALGDVLRRL